MCLSAAPQSEYTFSDCGSSSAPGGSAQVPSSRLAAAEGGDEVDFSMKRLID